MSKHMWTRPLAEMLTEITGSLLDMAEEPQAVRVTSIEMSLPIHVRLRSSHGVLVLCGDVAVWRWPTDWDPPFGKLRFKLEQVQQEPGQ